MIIVTCDICNNKPDEDFLMDATIFGSKIPFNAEKTK